MKIIDMRSVGTGDMLEVLDELRQSIESGKLAAFVAVGIEHDDATAAWLGSNGRVTRLRLLGATSQLMHCVASGDL